MLWVQNKILPLLFMENSLRGCLQPATGFLSVDNRMWFKEFEKGKKISMPHNVKLILSQKNKSPSRTEQREGTVLSLFANLISDLLRHLCLNLYLNILQGTTWPDYVLPYRTDGVCDSQPQARLSFCSP